MPPAQLGWQEKYFVAALNPQFASLAIFCGGCFKLLALSIVRDEIAAELINVYRFALRLSRGDQQVAEDIAQDVMVKAMSTSSRCENPQSLRAWMFRITANTWKDWVRAKQSELPVDSVDVSLQVDNQQPVHRAIELKESINKTMGLLDQLPQRQRSVLYLVACEQLSLHEVADVLQVSVGAVKASLCVARAKMRSGVAYDESNKSTQQEEMKSP